MIWDFPLAILMPLKSQEAACLLRNHQTNSSRELSLSHMPCCGFDIHRKSGQQIPQVVESIFQLASEIRLLPNGELDSVLAILAHVVIFQRSIFRQGIHFVPFHTEERSPVYHTAANCRLAQRSRLHALPTFPPHVQRLWFCDNAPCRDQSTYPNKSPCLDRLHQGLGLRIRTQPCRNLPRLPLLVAPIPPLI